MGERWKVREMAADLGEGSARGDDRGAVYRKELFRFLVHRVYLDGVTEPGLIRVEVDWYTGHERR